MVDLSKLTIKNSRISGKGVFAGIPIKKGKRICFLDGELMDIHEMIQRVDSDHEVGSDPLGIDDETYLDLNELSRTFNHSCDPNAYLRNKRELVALRDIKEGEEIKYDYSTTMNDNRKIIEESGGGLWSIKCKCSAKNCRGKIDQFKTLPKSRRDYYLKKKYAPNFIIKAFNKK